MTNPVVHRRTKRDWAIEFCEMTREQRERTDRSTEVTVRAALAAGLTPLEAAEHAGLTIQQVATYQEGEHSIGTRQG